MTVKGKLHPLGGGEDSPYKKNEVIFESATSGTYNVELLANGKYKIYCIAAGGKGVTTFSQMGSGSKIGGGSGSGFIGEIKTAARECVVIVGDGGNEYGRTNGENSSISEIVEAYGGIYGGSGAAGGALPTLFITPINTELHVAGNRGTTGSKAGPSVYNGYGEGGIANSSASWTRGKPGYVKIIYLGR